MKNKSILLTLGVLGTIFLVTALVIAHGNQSQEITDGNGISRMMGGMMGNSEDGMHGRGMMQKMMDSEEMREMHNEMLSEMKEHVNDLEDDEKAQEMIKHMESCPMMK